MRLLVGRLSLEWQRINGKLWTFLNENVLLTIVPVREASHVRAHGCKWLSLLHDSSVYWLCRLALASFKGVGSCCLEVHFVWIYDFCFFLKVESLFVAFEYRL